MQNKVISSLIAVIMLISLIVGMLGCGTSTAAPLPPRERLRVATTTSLYDTGLWEYLEPMFEEQYNVELDIIYAGTGKALEYGRRGDVDVITIHCKAKEEEFIAGGYGLQRVPFAYNYFLIVGPVADPAGIKGLSPEEAFKKLIETGSGSFVSRGDDSGTHQKEKAIWKSIGYDYEVVQQSGSWYIETGMGMGPTLLMASEKSAYTLSDMGTFLSYKGKLNLVPMVDKGDILLNVYSIIAINPEKNPKTNLQMASNLIDFLTSPEIQKLIGNYSVKEYGIQLFTPCAGAEPK
ncbi:MAG: tungsten ABC transporter substrate-binding protein [Dehalococcoidia bacterium]|nr:MAG: tungsten ABC transporter substrate-binding protein [Dehalococcoidia bacterium]